MKAIPNIEESAIVAEVFSVLSSAADVLLECSLELCARRRFQYIDLKFGFPQKALVSWSARLSSWPAKPYEIC